MAKAQKKNALIIENEYDVDTSIQAFLNDNPKLFKSVHEETFCRNKSLAELLPFVMNADAIIVASTFGLDEKTQTLEFVSAFLNPKFKKKLAIYVHNFVHNANEWSYEKPIWFDDKGLFEKIKQLYLSGFELFDFHESDRGKKVVDKFNNLATFLGDDSLRERRTFKSYAVSFSEEHDLFYIPNDEFNNIAYNEKRKNQYLERQGK